MNSNFAICEVLNLMIDSFQFSQLYIPPVQLFVVDSLLLVDISFKIFGERFSLGFSRLKAFLQRQNPCLHKTRMLNCYLRRHTLSIFGPPWKPSVLCQYPYFREIHLNLHPCDHMPILKHQLCLFQSLFFNPSFDAVRSCSVVFAFYSSMKMVATYSRQISLISFVQNAAAVNTKRPSWSVEAISIGALLASG